jgi:hypothetical protein
MLEASVPIVKFVFSTYVANVILWILHMFHTYVAYVLRGRCICFVMTFLNVFMCFFQVFKTHISSVSSVLSHILQMFHLDVSKID